MQEYCEFRIIEERAHLVLAPDEGKKLGSIRKITVPTSDARYRAICQLQCELLSNGDRLFFGWYLFRRYTKKELGQATLLKLNIVSVFEPAGASCGTVYDYSGCCPLCGAGAVQTSELILDLRKTPKSKDIARTIACEEWLVSSRLADIINASGMVGISLKPVLHKGYYLEESKNLRRLPSGLSLLAAARTIGLTENHPDFSKWINHLNQKSLLAAFRDEWVQMRRHQENTANLPPVWYQLQVTSKPLKIASRTAFGESPALFDKENQQCPMLVTHPNHVIGHAILSETFVINDNNPSDIRLSSGYVSSIGPNREIFVSQKFYRLLTDHGIKGCAFEVAHQV